MKKSSRFAGTFIALIVSSPVWCALTPSGPITILGQSGAVVQNLKITSATGDCIQITNSTNITIQNSEIGPCGGAGIKITGGNTINIYDNYIHVETLNTSGALHKNDNIYVGGPASNLTIQGNVIAYGEANIHVNEGHTVKVIGNFLLNPRGNGVSPNTGYADSSNFQCWRLSPTSTGGCSNVTVSNNYALSSLDTSKYLYPEDVSDSINFGWTDGIIAQNNFISGGHSAAGCGLISDYMNLTSIQFLNNRLLDTGQCGINIDDGPNVTVDSNKVYITNPVPGSGDQPIVVRQPPAKAGDPCGPVTLSNNISDLIMPDVTHRGIYIGIWPVPPCGPVTQTNNTTGAVADPLLTPVDQVFQPPLIPPQPKTCVAVSPYSNQTGWPSCSGSPCDVNKDSSTNVVDVQLAVNQALGMVTCASDINKDGKCDVIDVQRVVNAALGGACVSP